MGIYLLHSRNPGGAAHPWNARIITTIPHGGSVLPEHYLIAGLDALARSHPTPTAESGFADGHRAAAMLSAYFMVNDGLVEARAEAPI